MNMRYEIDYRSPANNGIYSNEPNLCIGFKTGELELQQPLPPGRLYNSAFYSQQYYSGQIYLLNNNVNGDVVQFARYRLAQAANLVVPEEGGNVVADGIASPYEYRISGYKNSGHNQSIRCRKSSMGLMLENLALAVSNDQGIMLETYYTSGCGREERRMVAGKEARDLVENLSIFEFVEIPGEYASQFNNIGSCRLV